MWNFRPHNKLLKTFFFFFTFFFLAKKIFFVFFFLSSFCKSSSLAQNEKFNLFFVLRITGYDAMFMFCCRVSFSYYHVNIFFLFFHFLHHLIRNKPSILKNIFPFFTTFSRLSTSTFLCCFWQKEQGCKFISFTWRWWRGRQKIWWEMSLSVYFM